jgi:hypothetical protein
MRKEMLVQLFPEIIFSSIEEKIIFEINKEMMNRNFNVVEDNAGLELTDVDKYLLKDILLEGNNTFNNQYSSLDAKHLLHSYLRERERSIKLLLRPEYEVIKKVFMKFNTQVPTSSSCERLFSMAKHIFTATRSLLLDEKFEKLLIMKCNL